MGAEIICWLEERPIYLQTVATPFKSHEHSTCNWCHHRITEPSYWLETLIPINPRDPYRCCTGAHRTCTKRNRNPQVGDSYWKLPRLEKYGKTTSKLRLFQVWSYISSMLKKGEGQEQKQEKSPWYLRCFPQILPLKPAWRVTEFCHPDTSKGGDLLRCDNSETLPSGKVT